MPKVLFIACSSFSGSTLLSFLLNTHPDIVTAGHTIGWRYKKGEVFLLLVRARSRIVPLFSGDRQGVQR
jgi:hypothetical protein